jgi:CheY-like chemotaxis protein
MESIKPYNPIHILLVEDNEGDILLTTEALEEGKIVNRISIARDGHEAITFLEERNLTNKKELPDLILLDVNLPKKNGHEVLQVIKHHNELKQIPVIILTTSSSESDIIKSYQNYANCFITKPVDVKEFLNVIAGIENFWISIVQLPPK